MAHLWSDKDIAPSCFTFLQQKIFCPFPVNLQNVGFIRKTLYLSTSSSEEGIDDQEGGQEGEEGQQGGGEGQGGGVQETLVPQLHLQRGGVFRSGGELEDGGGVGPALLVTCLDYHLIVRARRKSKEGEMSLVSET